MASVREILLSRTTNIVVSVVSAGTAVWDVFDVVLTDAEGTIGAEHGFALYATFSAICAVLEATGWFVEEVQELIDK
ncbi:MAG: hypothetical protein RLZZ08_834 [Pseudomonadota bacterium]